MRLSRGTVLKKREASVKIPRPLSAETHGLFFGLLKRDGIPLPETEFAFALPRKWRMDFAWPDAKVFLEVDGGIWTRGRHTRGAGWLKDTEKLNTAAAMGWRYLRCTPQTLHDLELIATIKTALSLQSSEAR
jgi:hypothetical protein